MLTYLIEVKNRKNVTALPYNIFQLILAQPYFICNHFLVRWEPKHEQKHVDTFEKNSKVL